MPGSVLEKYGVVLHDAEHSAFTNRALPGDREPRNPNHHRVVLAVSTAFWDAYTRAEKQARAASQRVAKQTEQEAVATANQKKKEDTQQTLQF